MGQPRRGRGVSRQELHRRQRGERLCPPHPPTQEVHQLLPGLRVCLVILAVSDAIASVPSRPGLRSCVRTPGSPVGLFKFGVF